MVPDPYAFDTRFLKNAEAHGGENCRKAMWDEGASPGDSGPKETTSHDGDVTAASRLHLPHCMRWLEATTGPSGGGTRCEVSEGCQLVKLPAGCPLQWSQVRLVCQ